MRVLELRVESIVVTGVDLGPPGGTMSREIKKYDVLGRGKNAK